MKAKREDAIRYAKTLMEKKAGCIIDTETTGLDGEARICDIAIIDMDGNVLIDTLVNPGIPIPEKLTLIHGITDEMVKDAPMWPEIIDQVQDVLIKYQPIVIYNADYDLRMLRQHSEIYGMDILKKEGRKSLLTLQYHCAMKLYSTFVGEMNPKRGTLKWHKLQDAATQCNVEVSTAHRALADCITTLGVIKFMAEQPVDNEQILHAREENQTAKGINYGI
jgi:DNA polymerase-3 subunit epsilon